MHARVSARSGPSRRGWRDGVANTITQTLVASSSARGVHKRACLNIYPQSAYANMTQGWRLKSHYSTLGDTTLIMFCKEIEAAFAWKSMQAMPQSNYSTLLLVGEPLDNECWLNEPTPVSKVPHFLAFLSALHPPPNSPHYIRTQLTL